MSKTTDVQDQFELRKRSAGLFIMGVLMAFSICSVTGAQVGHGRRAEKKENSPIGTWRGESKCVIKPSGCRDEDSVYRISTNDRPDNKVNLSANKIVAGKEVNFGSGECAYDPSKRAIDCPLPNGNSVHLEVSGASMEGKMTLRDGTFWRRITLRKVESQ